MGLWGKYVVPPLVSCACATKPIMKQRAKVVPQAAGSILEVGCGAGTNFGYYDQSKVERLYALEPSSGMIKRARKAASMLGWADRIEIIKAGAEAVPLEDNSIDTVVLTFVLCTIPDWQATLSEIRRVLKPGGIILFSEHGLAPDEDVTKWQKRIEPVWKPLVGGCHLTRDTEAMLREAGFTLDDTQTMYLPNTPRFAGFVSWGSARAS
ncbi:class I SAM-dependent methyltransferase [Henriciella litoralis]|uniref:class I SAM-dependent methyltransferase n=1 Tax=Henriciella litoralis TaxID=568102 RepID=UPI000A03FD99|nr:class I SAM-dependent methyltransferase [Henriciella litoralis]